MSPLTTSEALGTTHFTDFAIVFVEEDAISLQDCSSSSPNHWLP